MLEAIELRSFDEYQDEFDGAITSIFNEIGLDNPMIGVDGNAFGFELVCCMYREYDLQSDIEVNVEKHILCIHNYIYSYGNYRYNPLIESICGVDADDNLDGTYTLRYDYKKMNQEYIIQDMLCFYMQPLVLDIVKTAESINLKNKLNKELSNGNGKQISKVKV